MLSNERPDELRRLPDGWYQSTAWVHWTMAIEGRRKGWLDETHHAGMREVLIHMCARYHLLCPAYCFMPDHAHFLFIGLSDSSDQKNAVKFLRRAWNARLASAGCELQKQAHDHVLDESERNPSAFEDTLLYILNNPVRARLVEAREEWPFLGAIAAGFPEFDPRREFADHCRQVWKIHQLERRKFQGE